MTASSRSPFSKRVGSGHGRGVVATDRSALDVARIAARKGCAAAVAQRVQERFQISLPMKPARAQGSALALVGIGVDTWLATAESNTHGLAGRLRAALDDVATVTEQHGAYGILRLTGPSIREVLAKIVAIDLHDREFHPGGAAVTGASHIPLTLWRLADVTAGIPVFELAVPRSYADSFWHLVAEAAAEFGLVAE